MTHSELCEKMDAHELVMWMSYDLSNNEEFKKKTKIEIQLEEQKNQSLEEEERKLLMMFGLSNKIKKKENK